MIERFLKAKHWQLFIFVFGVPMVGQIILMSIMLSHFTTGTIPEPEIMFSYFKFFPIIMVLYMTVLFSWFWSVAIGLQCKIPSTINMKVKRFKIFFFIPLFYFIGLMIFMAYSINGLIDNNIESNIGFVGGLLP